MAHAGRVESRHPTPYERLGGASGVRALVDRFYDYMETLPVARDIRAMHPADLAQSRDKLYMFVSGWLGGPPLYIERHGHPRLRMRHLPFAIGDSARDAWLECMNRAVADCVEEGLLAELLRSAFLRMASHMRNTDEHHRPEDPPRQ
jgi:hemoglobin